MKIKLFIVLVILLGFGSCKKKDSTPPEVIPVEPTADPNNYVGVLCSMKTDFYQSGNLGSGGGYSKANFSSIGMINNGTISGTSLDAGNVQMNSVIFKKMTSAIVSYYDSTMTSFTAPHNWQVGGSSSVQAFSYSNSGTMPTFTGYAGLQDTIKLNQSNTINLQGISGADEIQVYVSTYFGSSIVKLLPGTTTSVVLSASDLASLAPTTAAFINVICCKNNFQLINGKTYKFQIGYWLDKTNVVIK